MTASQRVVAAGSTLSPEISQSWWDPGSDCTIVIATPGSERELWHEYVTGAERNYRKHGVERALDMEALRTGNDTALFCAGINQAGRVVGGLRAKGPYQHTDECHATVEWAGQPGLSAVRKMIDDRLAFGIVEMKTAWVCDDPDQSRALTETLARTPMHFMARLDIGFAVATAAAYVLKRWLSSGGVLAAKIPATPYPDERYQTKMMWWDRRTWANHAEPKQLSAFYAEVQRMSAGRDTVQDVDVSTAAGQ
jgi:hypothetical protein